MTIDLSRLYEPVTLESVASGLQALARAGIRDLPPGAMHAEPFACRRCLDTGTIRDLAGWEPSWPWQRYRPVPRIPCPDPAHQATTGSST